MTCIATPTIPAHNDDACVYEHICCHCGTEFCGATPADELMHDCATETAEG